MVLCSESRNGLLPFFDLRPVFRVGLNVIADGKNERLSQNDPSGRYLDCRGRRRCTRFSGRVEEWCAAERLPDSLKGICFARDGAVPETE